MNTYPRPVDSGPFDVSEAARRGGGRRGAERRARRMGAWMRAMSGGRPSAPAALRAFGAAVLLAGAAGAQRSPPPAVPGVVIDHVPASSGLYVGSPSLAVLPDGSYVASHDLFGPRSAEQQCATTRVFRSTDRGATWRPACTVAGQFWSTLFVHRGALYLIGTDRHHGNAIVRRSRDGGATWTSPTNAATGLLRDNGQYHCAPMPVIEHEGRLWRGMERRDPPTGWGITYCAGMLSAPVDADLLDATTWTFSRFLPGNRAWLDGTFGGWLEGNAVVAPDGKLVDILRVDTAGYPEKAAVVAVSPDGKEMTFDPATGFIDFPGGAKKFAIRRDAKSGLYWSLATLVPDAVREGAGTRKPAGVRNTLALVCSPDLTRWSPRCILLHHPDIARHGFQYIDWLVEGDDIIAVCRTAFDDAEGGAHNNHDANYLTFHRVADFRSRTPADSVPVPEGPPQARHETADLVITGSGFALAPLDDGAQAFGNRAYVWQGVPAAHRGGRFTQTRGGETAVLSVKARRDTTLRVAAAAAQGDRLLKGWRKTEAGFSYTDGGHTALVVFSRDLKSGEELAIPQGGWTGTIVLIPPERE